ncbi:ATP-binding cassette domain-containing protein [Streptomyces sp. NPDC052016]|uniref:ATP-binding cassette domain-containing protein n=1 Tax=Streptomyces sp. NPDC052016 TaxID=3365680 RepID=UPI0037CE2D24
MLLTGAAEARLEDWRRRRARSSAATSPAATWPTGRRCAPRSRPCAHSPSSCTRRPTVTTDAVARTRLAHLFAGVFGPTRRERAERVAEALAAVDLTDAADRVAGTCSRGMVRRLEPAQALVSVPRLLILDEPTIGLNPSAQTSVREHITAVREPTGMTVPVTTHSMDEADHYCDRVGLTHHGRIRALERAADPARDVPPGRDVRHARGPPRCGPDADRPCARLDQRSKGLNSLATAHSAHLTVH